MYSKENQQISYRLEEEADTLIIDVLRMLAEAADLRCIENDQLKTLDKGILKKCIGLIMVYGEISSIRQLSIKLDLEQNTLNKMFNESGEKTVNRENVDRIIEYMYKLADDYETQMKNLY
ncbi:hypothetical protein [Staphylococcus simulans]|uniref:hypothetical protein n=1 Tax=Staphylococcus simulans TaxID=1286 RepID=UPI003CEB6322